MAKEYVELRDGGYFISGTRVSLDSIIYSFLRGESPDSIADSFPALTLEEIFGALSFYLAEREAIDKYLSDGKQEFDRLREQSRRANPALYAKLAEARRGAYSPRG
jgi:uncharacterized protein (DUF433 family)